jgi:hypothetical protein
MPANKISPRKKGAENIISVKGLQVYHNKILAEDAESPRSLWYRQGG